MFLEFYYHRAGRTGRFDKKGNCYSFFNADSTKKPLALIENGVDFKFKTLKNGELVDSKGIVRTHPNKKKLDPELQKEITKINNLANINKKVKPGYKKKTKMLVEKAKQKHRRETIKKDIRRQRVERYRKESKNRYE